MEANATLQELSVDASVMSALISVFFRHGRGGRRGGKLPVLAYSAPFFGGMCPSWQDARLPQAWCCPNLQYYESHWYAILPKSWVLDKERSIPLLCDYVVTLSPMCLPNSFMGWVGESHSIMTPTMLSPKVSARQVLSFPQRILKSMVHYQWLAPDFPAGAEYNHVGPNEFGLWKGNWTKTCQMQCTREEKLQNCISLQKSFCWGTQILAKLSGMKSSVDPDN
jgi:hypothetical protein